MKPSLLKYSLPIAMGLTLLLITTLGLVSTTFTGCIKEETKSSSSGCGTTMGCCPATGCGTKWHGSTTQLCYTTANACSAAGNNFCRQCY